MLACQFEMGDLRPFATTRPFSLRNNIVNRAVEILLKLFAGSYSSYKSKFEFTKDLIIDSLSYKAHFVVFINYKIYFLICHQIFVM